MREILYRLVIFFFLTAGFCHAQDFPRHSLEAHAVGLFPITGFKAENYSAGPGLRAGYSYRAHRFVSAEMGWTGVWAPGTECMRFGCTFPVKRVQFADYGLRGILPLADGRVEASLGLGGGYIFYDEGSSNTYLNESLLQYSGKVDFSLDRQRRLRLGVSGRFWRDLGRPTQQWLSFGAGLSYGF